jgi:hypothetical protein
MPFLSSSLGQDVLFDPETDLLQMQNIPKVTRCLATLGKLVLILNFFF